MICRLILMIKTTQEVSKSTWEAEQVVLEKLFWKRLIFSEKLTFYFSRKTHNQITARIQNNGKNSVKTITI